jgi:hypothetical protein
MADMAEHLRVADLQAPVRTDVDGEDVIDDVRTNESTCLQAVLAQAAVE